MRIFFVGMGACMRVEPAFYESAAEEDEEVEQEEDGRKRMTRRRRGKKGRKKWEAWGMSVFLNAV